MSDNFCACWCDRYAILYAYGGVYADVDTRCLQPLSQWLPPKDGAAAGLPLRHLYNSLTWSNCSLLVALEHGLDFCQWTIAAAPRHPALLATVREIIARGTGIDLTFGTAPGVWGGRGVAASCWGVGIARQSDSRCRKCPAGWL